MKINENEKNPHALSSTKVGCLLGFWDTRKFIQKNFLHRKSGGFSRNPKLKTVYATI